MHNKAGMNRYQKAAHRPGERRVGREQVEELLEMSRSDDAEARQEAAKYLCPCHVRTRIPAVWEALYRMLEDPDVKVRRAAWHTLEDGGHPDDPALDVILERTLEAEADPQVLRFARQIAGPRKEKELVLMKVAALPVRRERGKCDFCGESGRYVEQDLETIIPDEAYGRPALICVDCLNLEKRTAKR